MLGASATVPSVVRVRVRTGLLAAAALAAAVAVYVVVTLPRAAIVLDGSLPPTHRRGAVHVHSLRSDGTGSVDAIAAAARRAGLDYIILADHGDATRPPDKPAYRDGVLVIDAVEISSRDGHVVALGLWDAAPYPLAGPARDVVTDVRRLGGVAVAAHPDSPKADLRWRAMNVDYDGIEWLNADSEWRDQPARVVGLALSSLLRPAEAIAATFSRPTASLRRWDQAARQRPVFGLAAADAHARIGWRADDEPRQRTALRLPTYESLFRALAQVVMLEAPPTGRAETDARHIVEALAAGRSYSIARGFADPATLTFAGDLDGGVLAMGDRHLATGQPIRWRAAVSGAPGARVWLVRNGERIASGVGAVSATRSDVGVYRVEVEFPRVSVPWIVSNPITVAAATSLVGPPSAGEDTGAGLRAVAAGGPRWSVEQDPLSTGVVEHGDGASRLRFTLGGGPAYGQYVALVVGGHDASAVEAVSFVGQASQPLRVSVQVRLPGTAGRQRWRRSVYLDTTSRPVTLRLQDLEPVERSTTQRPIFAPLHSLLFVVDTVNTKPATTASFTIRDLQLRVRTDVPMPEIRSEP